MSDAIKKIGDLLADAGAYAEDNKSTVALIGGVTAIVGLGWYVSRKKAQKKKPGTFDIGSGGVDRSKVQEEVRGHLVHHAHGQDCR